MGAAKNTIQKFVNEELGAEIRVIDRAGEPWFMALDLCASLEYRDTNDMTKYLDEDEVDTYPDNSSGQLRHLKVISEAGLYSLIIRSRKPEAKAFKRWITHDVLPSVRKHGAYMTDSLLDKVARDPETIFTMAKTLLDERERRQLAEDRLDVFKPRAPFGTISDANGRPRTQPIAGYFRTTKTTTTITEVTEHQRRLFDFDE